uniref:Nuclear pore complex protein Nup85 n=1 Tax=Glossina palpalis gambiensis TaxID=67801 RepID=A0A1B0C1H8_9MUSC
MKNTKGSPYEEVQGEVVVLKKSARKIKSMENRAWRTTNYRSSSAKSSPTLRLSPHMDEDSPPAKEGTATLELPLTKIPIKTEKQALKTLNICSKKQFINAEEEICKVQAKKSFTEERYENALE